MLNSSGIAVPRRFHVRPDQAQDGRELRVERGRGAVAAIAAHVRSPRRQRSWQHCPQLRDLLRVAGGVGSNATAEAIYGYRSNAAFSKFIRAVHLAHSRNATPFSAPARKQLSSHPKTAAPRGFYPIPRSFRGLNSRETLKNARCVGCVTRQF